MRMALQQQLLRLYGVGLQQVWTTLHSQYPQAAVGVLAEGALGGR